MTTQDRIVPVKLWLTPETHRLLLPAAKQHKTTVSEVAAHILEVVVVRTMAPTSGTPREEPREVRLRLDTRKRQRRVTPEIAERIREMYAQRYSVDEIAQALDVSVRSVYNHNRPKEQEQ